MRKEGRRKEGRARVSDSQGHNRSSLGTSALTRSRGDAGETFEHEVGDSDGRVKRSDEGVLTGGVMFVGRGLWRLMVASDP